VLKYTFGGGASQITDDLQLSTSLALFIFDNSTSGQIFYVFFISTIHLIVPH